MPRYAVCVGELWVAAVYDLTGSGIRLTAKAEDACTWVTHEGAAQAARVVAQHFGEPTWIYVTPDVQRPLTWGGAR